MQFTDSAPIAGVRLTRDGYAVAEVRAARTGIQQYSGADLGRPEMGTVSVYRPPESVFASDSLASYGHKPVTIGHPDVAVTADNWKKLAVGNVGGEVVRDGGFVRVPLALMDAAAIKAVQDGTREISMGYVCDLTFEDGVTPEGEAYQAIQRDIVINHLALVPKGRAGPQCRLGDKGAPDAGLDHAPVHQQGDRHMALKTITVDGLPVETTDAGEAAITKLQGQLATANKALTDAETAHATVIAAKDTELGAKDAKITELEGKVVTDGALDQLVADRAALVTKAKALAPALVVDGKSNADVIRAAVAVKLGDDKVKDKPDAYVQGLFDHLSDGIQTPDPLRDTIKDGVKVEDAEKAVLDARAAMLADLTGQKVAA